MVSGSNSEDHGGDALGGEGQRLIEVVGRLCGAEAVERLREIAGGCTISVPRDPKPHHRIVAAIGLEGARRVAAEFGHGRVEVPLGPASAQSLRAKVIADLASKGMPVATIARRVGVHVRTVSRHLGKRGSAR